MSVAGLGGFAKGLGTGLNLGKAQDDREKDRLMKERALDLEERRIEAGAYDQGYGATRQGTGMGVGPQKDLSYGADVEPMGSSMLWDLVDRTESNGGYDTLFGHSQNGGKFDGTRVSKMTLGDLRAFSDPSGEYGQWVKGELGRNGQRARVATPMGRWQIVGTTLRNTQKALGLSDDTVFDPQTQRQMADHLATQRLQGASSMAGKINALRSEWEGFKHVSDEELARAIKQYEGA